MKLVHAYPLSWPTGRNRTPANIRAEARFRDFGEPVTRASAVARLEDQLRRLPGVMHAALSCNERMGRSTGPKAPVGHAKADPGAAVVFFMRGRELCLACDRWTRLPDNISAIAAHIDALRGQERWGVGTLEEAFAGFLALPSPHPLTGPGDPALPWRALLGNPATFTEARERHRSAMRTAHPDAGGSHALAASLNAALEEARLALPP